MAKYAKDQPQGFENSIKRIAIVGAGGTIGHPITTALLSSNNHTLLALTRKGSTTPLPPPSAPPKSTTPTPEPRQQP
ncbi:hypothetical protein PRZ48_015276 [Zasmidium cellare]|uniref:NmrA-like domain-containing protein n=1 Tax=Zasmidium cellare TaxID=395010 RepID=A0ABR0DWN0_ZASCE|nr:hypothetical protein PRZ48_015276 [Zasmidium cellare]